MQGAGDPPDEKNQELLSEYHRARGELALARDAVEEALAALQQANRALSTPLTLESLAHAQLQAGRTDAAMAALGAFSRSRPGFSPTCSWRRWLRRRVSRPGRQACWIDS